MGDRAQVILVITGLGATPIETSLPVRRAQAEPVPSTFPTEAVVMRSAGASMKMPGIAEKIDSIEKNVSTRAAQIEVSAANPADLDLPAFMRRRIRQSSI